MDAHNSSDELDLRCLVREKMIDFLQKHHPAAFHASAVKLRCRKALPRDAPLQAAQAFRRRGIRIE